MAGEFARVPLLNKAAFRWIHAGGVDADRLGGADSDARLSIRRLDQDLVGRDRGVSTKIVSSGVPPRVETLWTEYQAAGYDTRQLFHLPRVSQRVQVKCK